jgi:hypothetical protein
MLVPEPASTPRAFGTTKTTAFHAPTVAPGAWHRIAVPPPRQTDPESGADFGGGVIASAFSLAGWTVDL